MTWDHEDAMLEEYTHIFENFEKLVDARQISYTEDSEKIRGGDCNTPRIIPNCIMNCKHVF
jgi:hypothetical protein